MTFIGWVQILLYCAVIVAIVPPLGAYMTRVFGGERTLLSPILRPLEGAIYKIAGVNERQEPVSYTHLRRRRAGCALYRHQADRSFDRTTGLRGT